MTHDDMVIRSPKTGAPRFHLTPDSEIEDLRCNKFTDHIFDQPGGKAICRLCLVTREEAMTSESFLEQFDN